MQKKIIINYGIYLGLSTVLLSVVKYTLGNYLEKSFIETLLGIVLIVVFIHLGIKEFKKNNLNFLSLSEAIKIGLGISLIAGLTSLIYVFIFSSYIEPEFKNEILKIEIKKLSSAKLPSKDLKKSISVMKEYIMPTMYFGIVVMNLLIGFIISLIFGFAFKKEKTIFEN